MTDAAPTRSTRQGRAATPFVPYLDMPARFPAWFWWAMRGVGVGITLVVMLLLVIRPQAGLDLFWRLVVPALPLVFAAMPGLWRQVCPMALFNQLPRTFNFSYAKRLPSWAKRSAFLVSVLLFVGAVVLRPLLFNSRPEGLLALLVGALALAFIGGLVFDGRSGWCGTFCPLVPTQRAYGQAPLVIVRNGYCPTCVGCQKNCYDFNPRAALHSDLADSDTWYSGHRDLFAALLPGLVAGFYTAPNPASAGVGTYVFYMGTALALSMGAFLALTRAISVSRYKPVLAFSMLALLLFYWFTSPVIAAGLQEFLGISLHGGAAYLPFAVAVAVVVAVARTGLGLERVFLQPPARSAAPSVAVDLGALRDAGLLAVGGAAVIDKGSGRSFDAEPGRSLLEGLESAGVKIDYGCRLGVCGADPVAVLEGAGHLNAVSATEQATLDRLGLQGRARMACVCKAHGGPVTIDTKLDPHSLPEPEPETPAVDLGIETGVSRVVIIGNGAAGATAAEQVRRLAPSVAIDLVGMEREPFYNRMAIARLLYGRTAMTGLYLNPSDWAEKQDITVWLNTSVNAIDRAAKSVVLGTGETLRYDKLILAQGARAAMPPIPGHDLGGCFVLRTAADAMAIREYRQRHDVRRAVVLGGGVLGIEAADALRHLNLDVTILQAGPRLMERQLDGKGAAILRRYLEGLGVGVVTNARVECYEGTTRLERVVLGGEDPIDAGIMVACAGIQPNVELAKTAGLAVARGVTVDGMMRTSDPDILAIGDLADLAGRVGGLWTVCAAHAKLAAASAFGRGGEYAEPNTLVSLKLEGIDVKGFGVAEAGEGQEVLVAADEDDDTHRRIVAERDRIVGLILVGPPGTGRPAADLIEQREDAGELLGTLRRGDWSEFDRVAHL